jgi:SpoU rRNA methylase family enzyme
MLQAALGVSGVSGTGVMVLSSSFSQPAREIIATAHRLTIAIKKNLFVFIAFDIKDCLEIIN